jgi:uncharacterized protein (TIRG00374 family)
MAWRVLRVAVALALLTFLLLRVDLRQSLSVLGRAQPGWLVVAAGLLLLVFIMGTVRWQLRLRARGYRFSTWFLFRVYLSGLALNSVLPTALGGDVLRMAFTSVQPRPAEGVSVVLVDRAVALVGLLTMALVSSVIVMAGSGRTDLLILSLAGLALLGVMVAAVFPDGSYRRLARILGAIRVFGFGERLLRVLDGVRSFRDKGRAVTGAVGISLLIRVTYSLAWYALGLAAGANVPFLYYLLYMQLLSIVTMLPLSIGGVGIRENGFSLLMARVGMSGAHAVAIALLFLMINYAYALAGTLVLAGLRRRKVQRPGHASP